MAIDVKEQTIERSYSEHSQWEFLFTHCNTHVNGEETATTRIVNHAQLPTALQECRCPEELFELLNTGIGQCVSIGFNQGMYEGLIITRIR